MLDPFLHSPLYSTLKQFDSTEANLEKLEQLWKDIRDRIPKDIAYVQDPEYDELCQWFMDVYNALPRIDGWKPEIHLYDLNEIASMRLDARELGEIDAVISVEESIDLPGRIISEYRRRFNKKRRELVRNVVFDLISRVDTLLNTLSQTYLTSSANLSQRIDSKEWDTLQNIIQQIEALIGKNISSLPRWGDLRRHLRFGQIGDLSDIVQLDWPKVKDSLRSVLYDPHEAIPVEVDDLGTLVDAARSQEQVVKKLNWSSLSSEEFERLIFTLISDAEGYENPSGSQEPMLQIVGVTSALHAYYEMHSAGLSEVALLFSVSTGLHGVLVYGKSSNSRNR